MILCHLEMYFPPSFFDIMVHLIVHVVWETKMCRPVFLRSMYPFERFMGILKSYVRNRSLPKGSIVEGYASEEVIEFCVDYMAQTQPIFSKIDIRSGYHHLKIRPEDTLKIAFSNQYSLYEFIVMSFGLTNVTAYFMNLMNKVFMEYFDKFVAVFIVTS